MTGFITILIFASQTWALNFEGTLTTFNKKLAIKDAGSPQKYYLAFINNEIQSQISKLKPSDFISLEGILDEKTETLTAFSLNYVGLKDLLGRWKGNDDFCYAFTSFTDIIIYNKTEHSKCTYQKSDIIREFTYTINPASKDWLALLAGETENYVMDIIVYSKKSVDLSLYDPNSGYILKEISLRK
jgi:hypothetical protein